MGICIAIFLESQKNQKLILEKAEAALGLVRQHVPIKFSRIQKFIETLGIADAAGNIAEYHHELKLCKLCKLYVLAEDTTSAHLAMTLVHEAMHGYLQSRGFSYIEESREQIERICVRAEISLAKKLPRSNELVVAAQNRLDYGKEFWTQKSFIKRELEALSKIGCPKFIVQFLSNRTHKKLKGRG